MFQVPPIITSSATIAGPMEGEGLLGTYIDFIMKDNIGEHASWEKCESYMLEWVIRHVAQKAKKKLEEVDLIVGGDLLNQMIAVHFALRSIERPFLGLYGACSTMALSMITASMMLDGGFADHIIATVSSHHDTAERQYRFPTELGVQRPLVAQWTVTGAGAILLETYGVGPKITTATFGKVVDIGMKDTNAMGPAMAPAAAATLLQHIADTGREPGYYDMIYTGDLGIIGKKLLLDLMKEQGLDIEANYEDCGCMIYKDDQDSHSGASGCASSAIALCSYILPQIAAGKLSKILMIGTGSLHSSISYQQKETIPCIAHAVALES